MHEKFVLFGTEHIITIVLTFAFPLVLAFAVRAVPSRNLDLVMRRGFTIWLIGMWVAWYVLFIARHWLTLGNVFPMNLCDWAMIAVLAACLTRNQKAYEIAYFWGLAGTIQGIVTPDVNYGFPEPQFLVFILGHAAIIGAVLYLTFGSGMRPILASIPRAMAWTLIYAAAAGSVDWLLGVNYGFFRAKPAHATFFDFLSPWPIYIPEMIAVGVLAILVLYAPWHVADLVRTHKRAPNGYGEGVTNDDAARTLSQLHQKQT